MVKTCHLLKGSFAIVVQALIGSLCVLTLLVKRYTEHPRRDWLIWLLDVTKQSMGATLGHFANIIFSMMMFTSTAAAAISEESQSSDECLWYCLSFLVDSTLGVLSNIILLTLLEGYVKKSCSDYTQRVVLGDYGNPISFKIFFIQLSLWLAIVFVGKSMTVILQVQWISLLNSIMVMIFHNLQRSPQAELIVVMIIIPGIINTVQFWITDMFLKRSEQGNSLGIVNSGSETLATTIRHELLATSEPLDESLLHGDVSKLLYFFLFFFYLQCPSVEKERKEKKSQFCFLCFVFFAIHNNKNKKLDKEITNKVQ